MARSDSFARKWASAPAQFERPSNTLIDRGWAGGAGEDPPEAKWENWWHNRVDEALGEIEALGAMRWFGDVPYSEMAEVSHGGVIYIAARPSNGIEPGSAADIGHWQRKPLGTRAFMQISSSQDIPDSFEGMALIDASAGVVTVTLPASNAELGIRDVIVRRVDNTGNRLVIQASGTDRIKFHTYLNPQGYAFLVLMGAGDFWQLRSDGAGGWWPVARRDDSPLGNYSDGSAALIPPGGYGLATGTVQAAEYPWLADYAQQSGALVAVGSRTAKDGRWSVSDDESTVYLPSPGTAFMRPHDPSSSRPLGSYQADAFQGHWHDQWYNSSLGRPAQETGTAKVIGIDNPNDSLAGANNSIRDPQSDGVNGEPRTASETRPENVTYYQLIKLI